MNQRRADTLVGLLVIAILIVGSILSWQAVQQQRAFDQMGSMMGMSMGAVHGTNPVWYVLGTIVTSAVVGGGYLLLRANLNTPAVAGTPENESSRSESNATVESSNRNSREQEAVTSSEMPRARILDILPDDERRVLEPVLTSPGITQIELRDRSDFSKSKVSQTVSALEKRGLLYREKQGRTYRIYPSDDLRE